VRVAIVDIGTNSTRLLIAEVENGRVTAELDRQTSVTRLGAGVDASGHLRDDAIQRVYATIDGYRPRIDSHRPLEVHAVLTSAVRDAANGSAFAHQLARRYGLEAHVISGDTEARLTYLGAISDRPQADLERPTLVVDIGGGSTELVIGTGKQISFQVSTQAGVVRQSERHVHSDPPSDDQLEAIADDVRDTFSAAVPPALRQGIELGIAVAGTPTSLAAIAQRLAPYDPSKTHGYILSAQERDAIFRQLKALTLAQRQAVPGLQPSRAGVIVPGIVILAELMELFGLSAIEVSEHDILYGAALAASEGGLESSA
jgi:exopolyphosphatase/guanosine-5'-triphosphate,3'-diphosphate pyrophosphatase